MKSGSLALLFMLHSVFLSAQQEIAYDLHNSGRTSNLSRDTLEVNKERIRKNALYAEDLIMVVYERNFKLAEHARLGLKGGIGFFEAVFPVFGANLKLGTYRHSFYMEAFHFGGFSDYEFGGSAFAAGYYFTGTKGLVLKIAPGLITDFENAFFVPFLGIGYAF